MTDPVSITGTAVGVLSLGIQACQGLTEYYRAWEGQDEEISGILGNLLREQDILELLQHTLAKQPPGFCASVIQVEECITQVNTEFIKLDEMLRKCRQVPAPVGAREKARNIAKGLLYPFRRETIRELKEAAGEVGKLLALAVQHLQLELSHDQRRNIATLLNMVTDQETELHSIKATASGIVHKVDEIHTMSTRADTGAQMTRFESRDIQNKLDGIRADTQQSATVMPRLERNTEIMLESLGMTQSSTQDLAQQVKLMLALVSKPSLQRDAFNDFSETSTSPREVPHNDELSPVSHGQIFGKMGSPNLLCECSERTRIKGQSMRQWRSITLFCSSRSHERHRPDCLFHSLAATRDDTIGVRVQWLKSFFASTLQLSLSFTRGAGGLLLSPILSYRPLVPRNAPAFSILDQKTMISKGALSSWDTPTPYLSCYLQNALREILLLFQNHAASPYDTTENCGSLLDVGCSDYY
ncbi:MAG: hypothetical protein M1820_004128 [Bogoriella megaspora]|nr:MAG: hypothetical protein M1820_004128 [Bogoriella megaspora]